MQNARLDGFRRASWQHRKHQRLVSNSGRHTFSVWAVPRYEQRKMKRKNTEHMMFEMPTSGVQRRWSVVLVSVQAVPSFRGFARAVLSPRTPDRPYRSHLSPITLLSRHFSFNFPVASSSTSLALLACHQKGDSVNANCCQSE